jgi:elongation factor 2 kinase
MLIICRLREAASKAIAEGDPWAKYDIPRIPAEKIIRHLYHPGTKTWSTDQTIVKMEKEAFTHGAMRFCYRMKKRTPPPMSATNHRFHNHGWTRASNFVAKAYHKDGEIDCSEEAKAAVQNDIMLQYEASYWAERFNGAEPPKTIVFIRAYAIEFPDREGKPWFPVERYIAGTDSYGCGFTKHNTNAGFVDEDLHRVTPQLFSAYSFYCSEGTRLVADIQGVGDLYTDPQGMYSKLYSSNLGCSESFFSPLYGHSCFSPLE